MTDIEILNDSLKMSRCPHCAIASPSITFLLRAEFEHSAGIKLLRLYGCKSCGSAVVVESPVGDLRRINKWYPQSNTVDDAIPENPKRLLQQALETIHAPDAAIMVTGAAVDAMLKECGYKKDSLYTRIEEAKAKGLLTEDMAAWAHEVRLDANDQRHADEGAAPATREDVERVIEFAKALAQYLFVLPSRIRTGREKKQPAPTPVSKAPPPIRPA